MVHTRTRAVESENLQLRTTPKKVCKDAPTRKTLLDSRASASKGKKARLLFSPDPPREHEFHFNDPPIRRLDFSGALMAAPDEVISVELEQRGLPHAESIGESERRQVDEAHRRDLVAELEKLHSLPGDPSETVEELQSRLELARTIRRRAELRRARMSVTARKAAALPHELPLSALKRCLLARRIAVLDSMTHYQAATALELALLKEDIEGLVGEGFAFGRRYVSVADLLLYEAPSDKELRDILRKLGVEKEVPRTKSEKFDMVVRAIESKENQEFVLTFAEELKLELDRRRLASTDEMAGKSMAELFELLFKSNVWRNDYDCFVDEPPNVEGASGPGACLAM